MTGVKRPAAVLGGSLMLSLIALMLFGSVFAYIGASALIVLTAVALLRRSNKGLYLLTATAAFVAASLLFTSAELFRFIPSLSYEGSGRQITGVVAAYPAQHPASESVVLKRCVIDGESTRYSVKVYFRDGIAPVPGDTVNLTASEVFCTADENSRYFYHTLSGGTWLSAFAEGPLQVTTTEKPSVFAAIERLRHHLKNKFDDNMETELSAVSAAIINGDQSDVPVTIRDSFRKSGISHLFAVSGMHLALWTEIIFRILQKKSKIRVIPNLFALLFILFYTAFTGFSPSVIRAGIMLSLICVGRMIRQHSDPLNSLGVSVTAMLAANPWLAGNVSFLLSATATYAIVRVYPAIFDRQPHEENVLKEKALSAKEGLLLAATVIATCVPFTAFFFGYFSAFAPVTSLLCTPLAELLMVFAALGACLPGGWAVTPLIFRITAALANAIVLLAEKAASLQFAILPLRDPVVIGWFMISAILLIWLRGIKKKSRTAALNALLGTGAAALAVGIVLSLAGAGAYSVYLPDAGNAAMIAVVSSSGGDSMLIGCGGTHDSYQKTKEFFNTRTAFRTDCIVIPRETKPHTAMLPNVLSELPPESLILPSDMEPVKGAPQHLIRCDVYNGEPLNGVRLQYQNRDDFCGGTLEINGRKLVFCLYPASDFSKEPALSYSGDVLICRGCIPATIDATQFESVIVLTDKSADTLHLPSNAVSTADVGAVTLTFPRTRNKG